MAPLGMVKRSINSTRVLDRLEAMVRGLPEKSAVLQLVEDQDPRARLPGWNFKINPMNPRSACIRGQVDSGFGVWFTIGQGTNGEIFLASRREQSNRKEEDRFFDICQAVFTTPFLERLTYDRSGKFVLRSRIILSVGTQRITLGGHQIFWWLYPNRMTKRISYEPYY
jgi:hypothetical protein